MTVEELIETAGCCDLKDCYDCPSKERACCQERTMQELAYNVKRLMAENAALRAQQEQEKPAQIEKVEINFYDKEEIYENCTVQVLTNTVTGEVSVGWRQNDESGGVGGNG